MEGDEMRTTRIVVVLAGALLCAASGFGQTFTFASIDAPGSTATWASGIGPGGQIVGGYMSAVDGMQHGFVYANGRFTTIDVPGWMVGVTGSLESEVNGISPSGDLVGDYYAPPGAPGAPACTVAGSPACRRGFLYRRGQFSSVLVDEHPGAIPSSIAPDGSIYGCFHDFDLGSSMFGFVRTRSGGFETLQAGGGEVADPAASYPRSMNNAATPDASVIVGLYFPGGAPRAHGFVIRNGVLTDYMFPTSTATQIWGINPNGDFVGIYRVAPGIAGVHGFVQPADGSTPVSIDYRDPVTGANAVQTQALAVNPGGTIVGLYVDASGVTHGFVAVPVSN
jgi:probable HAF family extracellular repeat protein